MPIIDRTNSVRVFGNVVYLDVAGIIPNIQDIYYCIDLEVDTPGSKVHIIFTASFINPLYKIVQTIVFRVSDELNYPPLHQQLQQVHAEHEEFTKATGLPFPIPLRTVSTSASFPTSNLSQATSTSPSFPLSNPTQPSAPSASSPLLNPLQPGSTSTSTSLHSLSSMTPTPGFRGSEWTDFDVGLCVPCSNPDDWVSDSEPDELSDSEVEELCPSSVVQTRSRTHHVQALPCSFLIRRGSHAHLLPHTRFLTPSEIVNRRLEVDHEHVNPRPIKHTRTEDSDLEWLPNSQTGPNASPEPFVRAQVKRARR
jgi:hypothetical protein